MNLLIIVLLFFSLIGFLDDVFHLNWGLKEEFYHGLSTIGSLTISMLGILSVGVVFVQNHIDSFTQMVSYMPFDPSFLFSALLAPDMGGYSISREIASQHSILVLNGVLLSSILGQLISFQIPVFVGMLPEKEHQLLFKSMIAGIVVIPVGLLVAGIFVSVDFNTLMINWIPVLMICGLIALGMIFLSKWMIRLFTGFAKVIQWITYLLFLIAVLGFLFPKMRYVPNELLADTLLVIFRIGLIVSGALVLSQLILKYCHGPIEWMAKRLNINEQAMIGLILSFATSLAMLPLYNKMDQKGKMICGAFSVSGAYVFGGQLAYISSVESGQVVTIYILTKFICGLLSILLVQFLEKRIDSL